MLDHFRIPYEEIADQESILESIRNEEFKPRPSQDSWDASWKEILDKLKIKFDPALLKPKFSDSYNIYRYNGRYVTGIRCEEQFAYSIKKLLLLKYKQDHLLEFGCGSGYNLVDFYYLFKNLFGFDWSQSAIDIFREINKNRSNIFGILFDMRKDNIGLSIDNEKSVVFTSGAMEQLGYEYEHFLDNLLRFNAKVNIHLEPIIEFYSDSEFDKVAIDYHKKRNYLNGFLTKLRQLKVNIIECVRTGFGSKYNEGFSYVVWSKSV